VIHPCFVDHCYNVFSLFFLFPVRKGTLYHFLTYFPTQYQIKNKITPWKSKYIEIENEYRHFRLTKLNPEKNITKFISGLNIILVPIFVVFVYLNRMFKMVFISIECLK